MQKNDIDQAFDLAGKVAVITGAASGFGRECARILAMAGATPVLADINAEGARITADTVRAEGGTAFAHEVDVADRKAVEALADAAIAETGRVDIWVNSAGIIAGRSVIDAVEEEMDRVIAVNLKGVYWGCAAAGRVMQARGSGSIINFSSAGADMPAPGLSIYAMTKSAVNMLTRTVAREFGPMGIRANAVAPGWVETPIGLHSIRDEKGAIDPARREQLISDRAQGSPLGITGSTTDIAMAVLYLASDASRFMTGQVLRPNGGIVMP